MGLRRESSKQAGNGVCVGGAVNQASRPPNALNWISRSCLWYQPLLPSHSGNHRAQRWVVGGGGAGELAGSWEHLQMHASEGSVGMVSKGV